MIFYKDIIGLTLLLLKNVIMKKTFAEIGQKNL